MTNTKPPKYTPPTVLIRVYPTDKRKLEKIGASGQALPAIVHEVLQYHDSFIKDKVELKQQISNLTEQLDYFKRIPEEVWKALDKRKRPFQTTADTIKWLLDLAERVEKSGGFLTNLDDLSQ